jgi:catechol 2,3-dioxygenase-like lactoylglutathione lyase family enzyme
VITVRGLHHVKVPVSDLTRSRAWYQTVLSLSPHLEFPDDHGTVRGIAPAGALGGGGLLNAVDPDWIELRFYAAGHHRPMSVHGGGIAAHPTRARETAGLEGWGLPGRAPRPLRNTRSGVLRCRVATPVGAGRRSRHGGSRACWSWLASQCW